MRLRKFAGISSVLLDAYWNMSRALHNGTLSRTRWFISARSSVWLPARFTALPQRDCEMLPVRLIHFCFLFTIYSIRVIALTAIYLCDNNSTMSIMHVGGIGPCPAGHQFIVPTQNADNTGLGNNTRYAECVCKDGHIKWFGDGACYRPFTRGPCSPGYIYSVNTTVNTNIVTSRMRVRQNAEHDSF